MREFRDRRDQTSWACSTVPQHVTQPSTSNNTHHPYPDPDHSSESKPLSLTTSCLPSVSSSGSPHLQSSPPHSALTPSLTPAYTVQCHQNRFFTPATDSQETADGVGSEQRGLQNQSSSEHRHHQLAPIPPQFTMMSETWYGLVQTPRDAYLLLEACRVGKLYRITRRLTDLERSQIIRPGAVFVWDEKEAGIKRWTDHVRWSPSRVSGAFLIYSELLSASSRELQTNSDPLLKQSFSSTTLQGAKLHLIAYYSKAALDSGSLPTPTSDSRLREIVVPSGIYPDHRATGGVEDDSVRERQRMSLLARHSNASLLESVPSATSVDSTTSSVDVAGRMQPITPTSTTSMPMSEFNFSHIGSLPESSSHRGTSDAKIYMDQPKYSPSNFVPAIYPMSHGIIDSSPPFGDRSGRWETYQHPSDWINPSGVVGNVTDHRSGGYGRLHTSGGSTTWGPTLPPLTTWPAEAQRERGGIERRFSTSGTLSSSLNGHSFHPYARPSDSTRGRSSANHNYTSKESQAVADPADQKSLSHERPTTPATHDPRGYNLPSMHQQPASQPCSSMGPPPSTKSDSPSSNVGQSRLSNGYSTLSPHFGSNRNVPPQLGNGLYQSNVTCEPNLSNTFHRTNRLSKDIGNERTVSNDYPEHQHPQNIQSSSDIKSSDRTPASETASQHDDNNQSLVSDQYRSFTKNKGSDTSNLDFEEED
ncbi:Gti1/Pac2 family-domain-containing protein [Melampsora americana]|nr:Gti1/Pac2 family-domain-containing protein [Melampsora americana]